LYTFFQILTLKAEALLKLCRPEEADTVIMSAQKMETALRKATGMPPDTNMLIVQADIDMALGRSVGFHYSHSKWHGVVYLSLSIHKELYTVH
jgi:hypothetical protein